MASPSKLTLLINRIQMNPSDSDQFSFKSHTRRNLSPIRYRISSLHPKYLPKLVKNLKSLKIPQNPPSLKELFIKSSNLVDISKLTSAIQTKNKLTLIQRNSNAYIKNSQQKKIELHSKIRSNQASPLPLPSLLNDTQPKLPPSHIRSISSPPKHMVDATFNTD